MRIFASLIVVAGLALAVVSATHGLWIFVAIQCACVVAALMIMAVLP